MKRTTILVGRFGVLSFCALPWPDASVSEAGISEVLPEVVDGRYAHLSREPVVDLLEDVVFCLFAEKLNVFASMMKFFLFLFANMKIKFYFCHKVDEYRAGLQFRREGL